MSLSRGRWPAYPQHRCAEKPEERREFEPQNRTAELSGLNLASFEPDTAPQHSHSFNAEMDTSNTSKWIPRFVERSLSDSISLLSPHSTLTLFSTSLLASTGVRLARLHRRPTKPPLHLRTENLFSRIQIGRRVRPWQSGTMVLHWSAAGLLEAERGFRKIAGYRRNADSHCSLAHSRCEASSSSEA